MAEASNFKIGLQVGFDKAHHEITPITKSGRASRLRELPKVWGSPLIFLPWLNLVTSNLVDSLGLSRPIIKSHLEEKWAWPWARKALKNLGFLFNISATAAATSNLVHLPIRPIVKSH